MDFATVFTVFGVLFLLALLSAVVSAAFTVQTLQDEDVWRSFFHSRVSSLRQARV